MPDDIFSADDGGPNIDDQQRRLLLQERIRKGLSSLGLPDVRFWIPPTDASVHGAVLITRSAAEQLARRLEEIEQELADLTVALGAAGRQAVNPDQGRLFD